MINLTVRPFEKGDYLSDELVLSEEAAHKLNKQLQEFLKSDIAQQMAKDYISKPKQQYNHSFRFKTGYKPR